LAAKHDARQSKVSVRPVSGSFDLFNRHSVFVVDYRLLLRLDQIIFVLVVTPNRQPFIKRELGQCIKLAAQPHNL
jgi:hypothetical protein